MDIQNKKQIAIIVLAVSLGLVAAVLTAHHIQTSISEQTTRLSKEFEDTKVRPLKQEMDAMKSKIAELEKRPVVAGAGGPITRGPQTEAPSAPKSSLALRTPAGKRAYTLRIDSLSAVGGLINPGDYVDVLAHLDMPDPVTNKKDTVSTMVFQNVQILAVGTNLQAPGGYEEQQRARSLNVTVALTPEESSLLAFIEKNGKLQLVLRAPAETETEVLQAATWSTLADYVFEKQGTELVIPRGAAKVEAVSNQQTEEVKPFIQIFRGGKEL